MASQSPEATTSLGKSLDPMPTAVTPLAAQARRLSSVGSTAPVHMTIAQGSGPRTFFTNEGPPTLPAGKTLTRSHPSSCA